jgi:hypothetical protein
MFVGTPFWSLLMKTMFAAVLLFALVSVASAAPGSRGQVVSGVYWTQQPSEVLMLQNTEPGVVYGTLQRMVKGEPQWFHFYAAYEASDERDARKGLPSGYAAGTLYDGRSPAESSDRTSRGDVSLTFVSAGIVDVSINGVSLGRFAVQKHTGGSEPPRASIDNSYTGTIQSGATGTVGQVVRTRIQPVFPRNLAGEAAGRTTHMFVLDQAPTHPLTANLRGAGGSTMRQTIVFWNATTNRGDVRTYDFNGTTEEWTATTGFSGTLEPIGGEYVLTGTTNGVGVQVRLVP